MVESYAKAQGLWRDDSVEPQFSEVIDLDLGTIEPSLAGPKRPQDRVRLSDLRSTFDLELATSRSGSDRGDSETTEGSDNALNHGDVVIAAITSCTNTSNPAVMIGAGLVARKARHRGLNVKPWVKTSLAPGSKVVTEYLEHTGLQTDLDAIGFHLVGYGCTTCIGNSGPLPKPISDAISEKNLVVASVLSGNRNFEGRVHQEVRTNWLASPPLVVAYALAGTMRIDLNEEPLGLDHDGNDVFLNEIWPTNDEIRTEVDKVSTDMFAEQYADVFSGPAAWQSFAVEPTGTYGWSESTYIKQPPFFSVGGDMQQDVEVKDAAILALLGDSVTTDHISPAGAIKPDSPAGEYLQQQAVPVVDFNSYGSRRGNHEVMMRGTFANIRIRNAMVEGIEGGYTVHIPTGHQLSIYDAAMRYQTEGTPLVVFAGKEYGTGSSRDWAAKGTRLLGVKAVVAQSFERIHRSNLVGMGVLPLQLPEGVSHQSLALKGDEKISIEFVEGESEIKPRQALLLRICRPDDTQDTVELQSRVDTENEIEYYRSGGILQYVLNKLVDEAELQHTDQVEAT